MNIGYFRRSLIATLFTLSVGSIVVGCGGSEERQDKYLQRAKEHFANENYDKAEIEAKNVLQINAKNSAARVILGKVYLSRNEFRQAFGNFQAAIEESPDLPEANAQLAQLYYAAKDFEKALFHAEKALKFDENNKEALSIQGGLALKDEDYKSAEAIANKILETHPVEPSAIAILVSIYAKSDIEKSLSIVDDALEKDPANLKLIGIKISVLTDMKDAESIEKLYIKSIDLHPDQLEFYYRLARGYAYQDRLDEAKSILIRAVDNNPENIDPKIKLVEFLTQRRGFDEAESTLRNYISENSRDYKLKELLSDLYFSNNKIDEGKALLRKVINDEKDSSEAIDARNRLIDIALLEKDRSAAENYIAEIIQLEPSNTDALISQARINLSDNDLKSGIANLRGALKNNPNSIPALKLLAFAHEKDNSPLLALESYRQVVDLDNTDIAALYNAGRLSVGLNQLDNAEKILKRAISVQSNHAQSIALLSSLYSSQGRWKEAEEVIDPLIHEEASKSQAFYLLANLYKAQSNIPRSIEYYKAAIDSSPTAAEPVGGYVDALLIDQRPKEAIEFLINHIENHPNQLFNRDLLGQIYARDNQIGKAIDIYKEIIETYPTVASSYSRLAEMHIRSESYQEAESTYKLGLENAASPNQLEILLANFYQQTDQIEKAINQYEEIIKRDEDNIIARNNLALLLINYRPSEKNLHRALELTSAFADTRNPILLDTVGWAYYNVDNLSQSIPYLTSAVEISSNNPEYRFHLGMAYYKNGELDKAKEQLRFALGGENSTYFGADLAKATLEELDRL